MKIDKIIVKKSVFAKKHAKVRKNFDFATILCLFNINPDEVCT
jgi:hypothetical protein